MLRDDPHTRKPRKKTTFALSPFFLSIFSYFIFVWTCLEEKLVMMKINIDRKRGGEQRVFVEKGTNYDHKRTCFVYCGGAKPDDGWRETETGKQKVQLYCEDDPLCPSRYNIVYQWVLVSGWCRECPVCGRCLFTTELYVVCGSIPFCLAICLTFMVSAYVSVVGKSHRNSQFYRFHILIYTVRKEMKCSGDSVILHGLVHDTSRICPCFSNFCEVSRTNSWKI